jgi:hypothetical protein
MKINMYDLYQIMKINMYDLYQINNKGMAWKL